MNIKLIFPCIDYKEQVLNYKSDFLKNGDSMDGTAGLKYTKTFEEWFSLCKANMSEKTMRKRLVPSTIFLAVDENNNLLGMIDIRHKLNDYLLNFGGHISYSVIKPQRQKGIATKILSLALHECKKMGILKVLICCDKKNIASEKVIIKNGGVLENEVLEHKHIIKRYWIEL